MKKSNFFTGQNLDLVQFVKEINPHSKSIIEADLSSTNATLLRTSFFNPISTLQKLNSLSTSDHEQEEKQERVETDLTANPLIQKKLKIKLAKKKHRGFSPNISLIVNSGKDSPVDKKKSKAVTLKQLILEEETKQLMQISSLHNSSRL